VPPGLDDGAAEDRHVHDRRRQHLAGLVKEDGDVEPAGQLLGGCERAFVAPVDQADARGLEGDRRSRLDFHRAGGNQRRDFRLGVFACRLVGPAGGFADVEEGERGFGLELARHLGEEGRFLGAGDQQRLAVREGALEVVELSAAELGVELDLAANLTRAARLAAGIGQRLRRERHGLFAVADEYAPAAPIQRQLRLPGSPVSRGS
jgi:hypothetical protein